MFHVIVLSIVALTNAALQTPPKITKTFEPKYYLEQTAENVKFQCTASGNPTPTMYWEFDGQRLNSTQRKKIYNNGTLEFVSIVATKEPGKTELPDWGRYRCFAENDLGKAMATPFDLYEVVNEEFTSRASQVTDSVVGWSVEIPCLGRNQCKPKEQCTVVWEEGSDMILVVDERIAIDTAGNLHFSFLKASDQKNTATDFYACAVWNELKGTLLRGSPMYLQITQPFGSVTNVDPNLAYNSGTVKALIGSRAVIQCVFTGKPVMDYIRWYKRGPSGTDVLLNTDPGSRYSTDDFDRKLVIKNVAEMDEASYICKANNGDDVTKEKSGLNFLDVQSPPIFVPNGKPRDLTLPEGADAILTCDARSLPGEAAPNIPNWFRNGQLVTGSSKYQFSNDKKTLTIKDVRKPTQNPFNPRDVAAYVCSVTNDNGTVYGSGYVNVIENFNYKKDLVFLMDGSADMLTHFNQSLQFMEDVVSDGKIDAGQLRVGFVIFSKEVNVEFFLTNFTTKQAVINAFRTTPIPKSIESNARNTASALRFARTTMFEEEFGGRAEAPDEEILIVAGKSNINSDQTIEEARSASASGIHIITIGLDISSPDAIEEIVSIASKSGGDAFLGQDPNTFIMSVKRILYRDGPPDTGGGIASNIGIILIAILLFVLLIGIAGIVVFLCCYIRRRKRKNIGKGEIMTAMEEKIKEGGLLSDDGLKFLASNLDVDWELVAIHMGLERPIIEQIKISRHNHGADNMILNFLKLWRSRSFKKDRDDDYRTCVIFDSLERCGKQHIIKCICDKYGLSPKDYMNKDYFTEKDPFDTELQVAETRM